MRGQVDYHLAQAGAAAGATATAHCFVRESAEGLARTLLRLHAERGLAIDVAVDSEHAIRGRREDLDEMLGNLLDNACKWARSRVRVGSALADTSVVLTVDDDGPGLDPALRERVLQRGVRADEAAPGTGHRPRDRARSRRALRRTHRTRALAQRRPARRAAASRSRPGRRQRRRLSTRLGSTG